MQIGLLMKHMEKFSSVERVVGKIPDDDKEEIIQKIGERFGNQSFRELEGKEREKTPEEIKIISLVNDATNEVRRMYGLEDFDVPPGNVHIIKENEWPKKQGGLYRIELQGVLMKEDPVKMAFMVKTFHEMIHFKSYNSMQVTKEDDPNLDWHRLGLIIITRDGKHLYFRNLNEAVTEEISKRFASKLFNDPLFSEETRQTRDVMENNPQAVVSGTDDPLFDDDTYYAEIIGRSSGFQNEERVSIGTSHFSYKKERMVLENLIDKIFERNPEKFNDRNEVFEIFAKGMMTGNILPVGRLMDNSFGRGTFRKIGEIDKDVNKLEEFVSRL